MAVDNPTPQQPANTSLPPVTSPMFPAMTVSSNVPVTAVGTTQVATSPGAATASPETSNNVIFATAAVFVLVVIGVIMVWRR